MMTAAMIGVQSAMPIGPTRTAAATGPGLTLTAGPP